MELHLNWNVRKLINRRNLSRSAVAMKAGLHPDIVGQMYANNAGRTSLQSMAKLARVLGVGIAPAPPPIIVTEVIPTLLRWEGDTLVWKFRDLDLPNTEGKARSHVLRELFFRTGIERSTLYRIDKGIARQTALATLERLATYLMVGIGEAYGNAPAEEYLLTWGPPRKRYVPPPENESPRIDRPSKVCMGPVCSTLNPEGVEKRTSAFPKAKRYRYGVGPICKACRRWQEQQRRLLRKAQESQNAPPHTEPALHAGAGCE